MMRVLFVCLGNICRSPAGENVMRAMLKRESVTDISLDSAGTAGYHIGKGPDPRMSETLEGRGIPVTGSARQFTKKDFDNFDLIIAMDDDNRRDILRLARNEEERAKVRSFMSFCQNFSNEGVPDPYYGEQEGFDLVADIMSDGCQGILREILGK